MKRCVLALEDGAWYEGYSFGAEHDAEGEVVFCTSMTGYQEICTDASYRGQMVVLTYPLIGIYGVVDEDAQSYRPWAEALIVRDYYDDYSNWRAEDSLHRYLQRENVPAIAGVDTRALTRHLRTYGTMRAVLRVAPDVEPAVLVEQAGRVRSLSEKDLVGEVTVKQSYTVPPMRREGGGRPSRIVVVDCGAKANIVHWLSAKGAEVVVVPANTGISEVQALRPDGVVFSNGPGDPTSVPGVVATMRQLLATETPMLGICLGHQMLGLAIGGSTSRLKFGHHGGNHPVRDNITGKVYITSQNHEFQVEESSLAEAQGFFVSHVNLNDGSVEGLAHRTRPVFSVQYHPEAGPGPQDNLHVFDKFLASCQGDR
ncbi:MAG: glutamine-hydrolyzing carbamoyl-phosphate synthase small subunit [Chloroflexota bacterium]